MTSHKILTILLIILAIFLGASVFLQNKKVDEGVVPPVVTEEQVVSTTTIATTTVQTATTTPATGSYSKEVSLTTENYFEIPDGSILSIKRINDSRCAANVNCVWAGNVIAVFNAKIGTVIDSFELKFGPGTEATKHTYHGYTVSIVGVSPDKGPTSQIIGQKDYKITVKVTK
ncbi:hypothetical protein H7X65_02585 [Candidatus Parcubacteria bacterium]|nr:hypothetical protein [Candidatus Parcubacteria bacterium]